MHELSIASAVVDSVLDFISERSVKRVITVRLAVGELSHVEAEQLSFCYTAITQETPLQDSTLEIETVEAAVKCEQCSYHGRPKYWDEALSFAPIPTLECPKCGAAVEVVEGKDCAIRSVRFATEDDGLVIPAA